MPGLAVSTSPLDVVAHVIQVALTPVFLLSGIATLLNVFSTRLARVADLITKAIEGSGGEETAAVTAQLARLRRRSLALDTAVVLAAVAGALTCVSVLTLFVGALKDATVASVLVHHLWSRRPVHDRRDRRLRGRDADRRQRHARRNPGRPPFPQGLSARGPADGDTAGSEPLCRSSRVRPDAATLRRGLADRAAPARRP